jgi:hypothetical protein
MNHFEYNEEELKKVIEDLYTDQSPTPKKQKKANMPDEKIQYAVEKALAELEVVRQAFLAFQDEISELAITPFLMGSIEEFSEACIDIIEVLNNNFDPSKMSNATREKYKELQALRIRILTTIYLHYKGENEP